MAPEEKGIYSISALATDNVGEKTLSPPVTVMVYDGYVDSSVAQDDSLFEVFLPYNEDSIIRPVAQDVREAEAVITSVSRVVTATAVTASSGDGNINTNSQAGFDLAGAITTWAITDPGFGYLTLQKYHFTELVLVPLLRLS